MLHFLSEYARKHELDAEPGFEPKTVKWALLFDASGRYLNAVELGDAGDRRNRGRVFPKCPALSQPEMKAGGVTKSHFLADSVEVIALAGSAPTEKARKKHAYFLELLRMAGGSLPILRAVAQTMGDPDEIEEIKQTLERLRAKPSDSVTIQADGRFPIESDEWHEWWRDFRSTLRGNTGAGSGKKTDPDRMRCYLSGKLEPPAATHPKIKGLGDVGGLSMGDVLIGFKQPSFCSYGLAQSANAAMSEQSAMTYRTALNALIADASQRFPGAKVVHWFKGAVADEDDPFDWLMDSPEDREPAAKHRAARLLASVRSGQREDLAGNQYYAMTLSGAGGRVMVRDWMEGEFVDLVRSVDQWFDDLTIVHRSGNGLAPPPKFLAVAGACVRKLDEIQPNWLASLWRSAIQSTRIPHSLMAAAFLRVKINIIEDEPMNHARMSLLRAYHIRKARLEGDTTMADTLTAYLNPAHPHPAYHCGRWMAVLAALQRAALPNVGAGIVQRYYAAASTTPALVLGRLVRTSQFHLDKLDGGLAHWYETKLSEISSRVGDRIPATLTLEEQSLFALGYYQQIAGLRTKKRIDENEEGEAE